MLGVKIRETAFWVKKNIPMIRGMIRDDRSLFFIYMKKRIGENMRKILVITLILALVLISREKAVRQEEWESSIPRGKEKQEEMKIRVLLKSTNFEQTTHGEFKVSCEQGMTLICGEKEQEIKAQEILTILPTDKRFVNGSIRIMPNKEAKLVLHHMERNYGMPSYCGELELFQSGNRIVIINEIPLETYLRYVVPSEMPSSYEMEALKAQAICARSYAYGKLETFAYPEYQAHVDDSTSFQVYGNIASHQRTDEAVETTESMFLMEGEEVAEAFFFSTSCGNTTSVAVVNEIGEDYEKELPWYRWQTSVSRSELERILETFAQKEIGTLRTVAVTERGEGGIALQMQAVGTKGTIEVATENKIRRAFADESLIIKKQDGSKITCANLLPSAFFTITEKGDIYYIEGGGYGHGTGMSQNGANEMAKAGKTYVEILQFFYPGAEIVSQ